MMRIFSLAHTRRQQASGSGGAPAALALFAAIALAMTLVFTPNDAAAQRLVATVNDSPITNYDVAQRVRLLRALRMPASNEAALESLIEERLKLAETKKFKVSTNPQQVLQYIAREAQRRKIPPQALNAALQSRNIDDSHWREYFQTHLAWDSIIAGLYRSVNVGVREIDRELERRDRASDKTEYTVRQVILVVPRTAGPQAYQQRMREANGLRARFRDCEAGAQLVRGLRDAAIQNPVSRSAADLNEPIVKMLENTPIGGLTRPQAGPNGIEMLALCNKRTLGALAAGQSIQSELLERRLEAHSQRRYKELRDRAIIVRR